MNKLAHCCLLIVLCVGPTTRTTFAHPGNLDLNGGHFLGNSYHCHLPGCVLPDTFDQPYSTSFLYL